MNTFSEKLFIFIWLNKYNFISLLRKTVGYNKYSIQFCDIGRIKEENAGQPPCDPRHPLDYFMDEISTL